jgi:prophage DNA circulation protein
MWPKGIRRSVAREGAMEPNEEMVVVSRAALEQLQRQIDGLPDVFAKSTHEIGRALTARLSRALDDLAAQLTETTEDALRAIRDAIPTVIAQHAPEISPAALEAITEAIYARAAERFATLHAAQRILRER